MSEIVFVMWWVIIPLAVLWLTGWINSFWHVQMTYTTWYGKVLGAIFLFFAWPYIAWAQMRQMG
jgi:hypothetical protein